MKDSNDTGEMSTEPDELLDLVSHQTARCILAAASEEPCTAEELAEACDVSPPTVYRHVSKLQEHGFLEETLQISRSGDHRKAFETTLKRISLVFEDGLVSTEIRVQRDFVDKFRSFWEDLEDSNINLRW